MSDYKIGDKAWIHLAGGGDSNPFLGKVVAILDLPGWCIRNYVIALETEMDPLLEVRSANAMTPEAA